jgi:hypothetical protein
MLSWKEEYKEINQKNRGDTNIINDTLKILKLNDNFEAMAERIPNKIQNTINYWKCMSTLNKDDSLSSKYCCLRSSSPQ